MKTMKKRFIAGVLLLVLAGGAIFVVPSRQSLKAGLKKAYAKTIYLIRLEQNIEEAARKTYLLSLKSQELLAYTWQPEVCINELYLPESEAPAWLELFNPGNKAYDLFGHFLLVKSSTGEYQLALPAGSIPPRGHWVVGFSADCPGEAMPAGMNAHIITQTGQAIQAGDVLYLTKESEAGAVYLDSVMLVREKDRSWSRMPDGKAFRFAALSMGAANHRGGIVLMLDDKRIDNHYSFRDVFSRFQARMTFAINARYRCQFYSENNPYGLMVDFGDTLSAAQAAGYAQLIADGHEIGNHHYEHIRADQYVSLHGEEAYVRDQILAMDRLFEAHQLPRIKSFVYSNHRRNELTDSLISLRYFNFRGKSDAAGVFAWKNERLLSGFRLDHHAESPLFMYDLLFHKMPGLIDSENVLIMWGHGVTDQYERIVA